MSRTALIAALVLSCVLAAGCPDSEPAPPPPGRRPPPSGGSQAAVTSGDRAGGIGLFRLPMTDGHMVTVKTPAALFFYTTWCGYCKQAMPEIKRLAGQARNKGWWVYGVDVGESAAQAQGFIQTYQPNFPILVDQNSLVANQYGITGYPTFILIDRNGNVAYRGHEVPKNF